VVNTESITKYLEQSRKEIKMKDILIVESNESTMLAWDEYMNGLKERFLDNSMQIFYDWARVKSNIKVHARRGFAREALEQVLDESNDAMRSQELKKSDNLSMYLTNDFDENKFLEKMLPYTLPFTKKVLPMRLEKVPRDVDYVMTIENAIKMVKSQKFDAVLVNMLVDSVTAKDRKTQNVLNLICSSVTAKIPIVIYSNLVEAFTGQYMGERANDIRKYSVIVAGKEPIYAEKSIDTVTIPMERIYKEAIRR
jgi:hypothetical protein